MMFKAAAAFALLPLAFSSPQYGYGPAPGPAPTSSSSASSPSSTASNTNQMIVQVGNGGFSFSPADIQAPVGTIITFSFQSPIQHSVTQSTFADPCTPMAGGFDSGLTTGTTFSVNVTDASTPVYFFCKAPTHCGAGMVGTINAPSSGNGTNSAFMSAALAIGSSEQTVQDNGPATGGVGAVATAGPTTGTPSFSGGAAPTSSGASPSPSSGGSGGTSGAASLVINNGLAAFAIVAGIFAVAL